MHVSGIEIITGKDFCRLQATVITEALDNDPYLMWFQVPVKYKELITRSGNPFVAALLLPCMVTGEVLYVDGTVSAKLFESLYVMQDIYKSWDKDLQSIKIIPSTITRSAEQIKPRSAAVFFSGGADSLYTLLKQAEEEKNNLSGKSVVEYLLLVRGFDISVEKEQESIFNEALKAVNLVAEELHKKVLPVSTNIREFMDLFVPWGLLGHGACLAGVGLLFNNSFYAVYIGSTYAYDELVPWGSHPLSDPLWSTEDLKFIHDGCEANKLQKLRFISQFPIALNTLRVCYELANNSNNAVYNCGKCSKCLRTMIGLHILGVLDKCTVFPHQIDLDLVRKIDIAPVLNWVQDLHNSLKDYGYDAEIKAALKEAFKSGGFNPSSIINNGKKEPAYLWQKFLNKFNKDLINLIDENQKFVIVDQDEARLKLKQANQAVPFLERDGIYNGVPANAETAIAELQRLCKDGAAYIVVASPAFWWLKYYKEWHQYLRSNFNCILENERMVIFDLRKNLPLPGKQAP